MNDNITKSTKDSLTEGTILKPLMLFSLPVLGSLLLQSLYGAVDLLIVGKYGVTADVSAVTTGTQIISLLTHTVVGLSMGTTVLVGQSIGAKRTDRAGKIIGAGIILFTVVGILLSVCVPLLTPQIATLLKAPQAAFYKSCDYIRVCGIGLIFVVAYNILGSIFRGIGDSKTPLLSVMIACVLNIFGDLFFVKTLKMAAKGAALATVLSQAISVIICLVVIIAKKKLPFKFDKSCFRHPWIDMKSTIRVGIPIALQQIIVSFSFMLIVTIINDIGLAESAGVGVAEKVCTFIMLFPAAFSQSLSAFVAQNVGANKMDRAEKGLKYCIGISIAIGAVIGVFAFLKGDLLTGLFSKDPEVIYQGWQYLKGYAIDVFLTSFMFCFIGYFNGIGKTTFVMLQGVLSAFCIRVPVSLIMSRIVPVSLFRIALATPSATLTQTIACLIFFGVCRKKNHKSV